MKRLNLVRAALTVALIACVAMLVMVIVSRQTSGAPAVDCTPRAKPISQAPASLVSESVVAGTDGRLDRIVLHSPAMDADVPLYVLLPLGYDTDGRTRYPVLYLLHGAGNTYETWIEQGVQSLIDRVSAAERLAPFITVMPDGGADGFFSDWIGDNAGAGPAPAYATYDIHELVPWIDEHFRTRADRRHRAIAGVSMGGFGAMSFAARHPDLFGVAGSFSGALDTDLDYPVDPERLSGGAVDACMWGSPVTDDVDWRAVDPTYLAPNLGGLSLFLASGNGRPPRLHRSSAARGVSDATEVLIWQMNTQFSAALNAAKIGYASYFYGPGRHAWPYWLRDLRHFLPNMEYVFAHPSTAPPQIPFNYRTTATHFTIWGWTFSANRATHEFTYLTSVTRRGLIVAGSGTLTVTTAPLYRAGRTYRIVISGARPLTVSDGTRGRLTFTVALGPSHAAHQTSFPATGAPAGWHRDTVEIAPTHASHGQSPIAG